MFPANTNVPTRSGTLRRPPPRIPFPLPLPRFGADQITHLRNCIRNIENANDPQIATLSQPDTDPIQAQALLMDKKGELVKLLNSVIASLPAGTAAPTSSATCTGAPPTGPQDFTVILDGDLRSPAYNLLSPLASSTAPSSSTLVINPSLSSSNTDLEALPSASVMGDASRRVWMKPAPYHCHSCDANFTARHIFGYHINSHLRYRPYKCPYESIGCAYVAAAPRSALHHVKTCQYSASGINRQVKQGQLESAAGQQLEEQQHEEQQHRQQSHQQRHASPQAPLKPLSVQRGISPLAKVHHSPADPTLTQGGFLSGAGQVQMRRCEISEIHGHKIINPKYYLEPTTPTFPWVQLLVSMPPSALIIGHGGYHYLNKLHHLDGRAKPTSQGGLTSALTMLIHNQQIRDLTGLVNVLLFSVSRYARGKWVMMNHEESRAIRRNELEAGGRPILAHHEDHVACTWDMLTNPSTAPPHQLTSRFYFLSTSMANNTLGQSTRLVYHDLASALSLDDGANFALGECVLVRIPGRIQVEGHVDDEATAVGTGLPPTSNETTLQHFAFIRQMEVLSDGSYALEVYPVVSFTRSGETLPTYNRLTDAAKASLLPLPPLSFSHPTPDAFGPRLNFGTWRNSRDSFLLVNPRRFIMPTTRPFKQMDPPLIMPASVLYRIERYRETLGSFTNTHNHDDHPLPNGGSGDEQGSSNPRHGRTGDRGGQAASGVMSVNSPPAIIGDGGGEKAAGAGLEQGLLVLEGVDEDAEGPDATMLDQLMMLAYDDPIWNEELRRYLQKEEEEREWMQKERAVRLARWREDVVVQPT